MIYSERLLGKGRTDFLRETPSSYVLIGNNSYIYNSYNYASTNQNRFDELDYDILCTSNVDVTSARYTPPTILSRAHTPPAALDNPHVPLPLIDMAYLCLSRKYTNHQNLSSDLVCLKCTAPTTLKITSFTPSGYPIVTCHNPLFKW